MIKKIQDFEARLKFYEQVASQKLTLAETVKAMRSIVGLTQPEYAKLVGIAPRIIIDLERGVANPTLATLKKIGKPFSLDISYRAEKNLS